MRKLTISNIEMTIQKKQIKNMYIRILAPDGEIRVTAPLKTTDDAMKAFISPRIEWIKEQRQRIVSRPQRDNPKYITGESVRVLGKKYPLEVVHNEKLFGVSIDDGRVILQAPENSSHKERDTIMNEWYRQVLKKTVPPLLAKCESIVGVTANEWRIKNMRTRWGSCSIRARRIWLSLNLAKESPECIEYIIIHELVHLLERGHNKRFYAYMDRFCPNWRVIKAKLNE